MGRLLSLSIPLSFKCVITYHLNLNLSTLLPSGALTGADVLNSYIFNSSWWDLIPNQVSLPVISIIPGLNQATVTIAYLGDVPNGMFKVQ